MSLWFKYQDIWLCAPPKCGGTALYCAALGISPKLGRAVFSKAQERVTFHQQPGHPAIMAVRDPAERFASLWRDKCRDGDPNLPLGGLSPDELMDLIESDPDGDPHWMPQERFWVPHATVVRHTDIGARLGLVLKRVNHTRRKDTDPPMPVNRIRKHYKRDYLLCSRL